eukprot:1607594-Pleurochrysis_carterae.AAC.1
MPKTRAKSSRQKRAPKHARQEHGPRVYATKHSRERELNNTRESERRSERLGGCECRREDTSERMRGDCHEIT